MYENIKSAALYLRYSSSNQTEQSIEGQTRVCTEFANRHNITITKVYADRATSASKDIEKRVNFLQMIKDSERNLFDAVIVYKLDRFARSRYDMATYKFRLKKNGVTLISATENISSDPEGIILESVLEGMAEFYSAELAQKINRGLRESSLKHQSIGGHCPLGYKIVDKKLEIDSLTAPLVVEAYELFADGKSIAEICRIFNEKGYRTSTGGKFNRSSFNKLLQNEKYIGVYQFHDYRAEDAIPRIIPQDLWEKVQKRLAMSENRAAGSYKAKRIYLLSGKLFCGHCGNHMNGDSGGNAKTGYYQCYGRKNDNQKCHKKALRKDFIETVVVQDALALLTDENIETIADTAVRLNNKELENTTNIPALKDRLTQVTTSLGNLMKAIEVGQSPEILVKRIIELENEKRTLENQLKEEEKEIIYLDKPKVIYWLEQFKNGDIEDENFKKQVIDLFIKSVTVWDEDDDTFKITITYNLSQNEKTYHLDTSSFIGFIPPTSTLKIESDRFSHTIRIRYKPHSRLSKICVLPSLTAT